MPIKLKRVYDTAEMSDGYRILVDRLWPRGVTKEKANLDEWAKEVAPSNELRKWFHSDRTKTVEFKRKYLAELKRRKDKLNELAQLASKTQITLLYASNDPDYNHAMVLKEHLEKL